MKLTEFKILSTTTNTLVTCYNKKKLSLTTGSQVKKELSTVDL